MKRFFPVLLVLLLISCMVVPASASTVDAIEDQNFWLMGDLDWFDDAEGALGAIYYGILDVVDRLDWLDSTLGSIEQAVWDYCANYIQKIYTYLQTGVDETLGEIVVGIKQAIENMNTNISSGVNYLRSIKTYVQQLVEGFCFEDEGVIDEAEEKQDSIDDITDILETAPSINPDDIDSVISDVGDKFENITSDADGGLIFAYLKKVADFEVFKELIPTSAMLGVLSFILFGKVF